MPDRDSLLTTLGWSAVLNSWLLYVPHSVNIQSSDTSKSVAQSLTFNVVQSYPSFFVSDLPFLYLLHHFPLMNNHPYYL